MTKKATRKKKTKEVPQELLEELAELQWECSRDRTIKLRIPLIVDVSISNWDGELTVEFDGINREEEREVEANISEHPNVVAVLNKLQEKREAFQARVRETAEEYGVPEEELVEKIEQASYELK